MNGLQVTLSAPLAAKAAGSGVDGVVISGTESGGLRSQGPESTNLILIPLVCDMVDVPVIAAGGIADSRGYKAALALGAQGVQLGTAFLASEESPACQAWKDAIVAAGDAETMLLPIGGMSMRSIINPKLSDLIANQADLTKEYNMMNAPGAWNSGDFDLFPAGAGQISALIKKVKPVKDIVQEMIS